MKNKLHLFLTFFTLLFCTNMLSSQTANWDMGMLNGASYEIQTPANWNKNLVMYAHGYEQPNTPHNVMVQKDSLCYELRVYWTHPSKLNDLMKRFRNHTTKLFEKHGMTNVGYWTPLDNPDGKLYYVLSYPNRAAREVSWKNFMADTTWKRVASESEVNGKIVSKVESVFLKTTDFSPNNFTSSNNGVWEFRIYTATPNNLVHLLQRFRGFTVNRFAQYGMDNKAYWTATDAEQGSDKMLYYFLTHPSEEAAKVAFDKFRSDPEWIATRKASEVKGGGSLTVKVESIFMVATDFSKLK
jgi:NIPSNAP